MAETEWVAERDYTSSLNLSGRAVKSLALSVTEYVRVYIYVCVFIYRIHLYMRDICVLHTYVCTYVYYI